MPEMDSREASGRRGRRIFTILGLLLLCGGGVFLLRHTVLKPKVLEVKVAEVRLGTVEDTVANTRAGTVKLRRRAGISPQIGGRVVELPAREGMNVRQGDLLLRLDDSVQQADLEVAEKSVETAAARADEACFAADQAARELRRFLDLRKQGIASDSKLDLLQSEADRTRAGCRAARAAVKEAEARIHLARVQLELCRLSAPFAGIIGKLSTQVGEWVTPSPPGVPMPPILDLLDPSSAYISAPIDEMDAERVHSGQPARISVDSRSNEVFPGHVVRVAPFVEDLVEQNRTIEIEAEFDDPETTRGLLPGVSADIEIILEAHQGVLEIPTLAISNSTEVYVFSDGIVRKRVVKTGLSNWKTTEIISGLDEGEKVVISRDSTAVTDGARARVDHGAH